MARRKVCLLLLLALLIFVAPGCWDYREINELAIVTGLGVDVRPDSPEGVSVTALIALPGNAGGGGGGGGGGGAGGTAAGPPALMETAHGVSLGQAFERLDAFTGRQPVLSHIRVAVFGEQLARRGLEPVFDVFTRWYEFRRTMVVFVARPGAEQCLNINSPLTKDPTNFLLGLSHSPALGGIAPIRFQDILDGIQSTHRETVMPLIEPVRGPHVHVGGPGGGKSGPSKGGGEGDDKGGGQAESPQQPSVRLAGLAVFRRDQMVGTLNPAETLNWLLLTGRMKHSFAVFPDPRHPGKYLSLLYGQVQRQVKAKRGSPPSLQLTVNLSAEMEEVESGEDYSPPRARDWLEAFLERQIQRDLERLIRRAQHEFKTDIFAFGEFFVGKFLYWNDWLEFGWLRRQFPVADIRVKVRLTIQRPGTTFQPIRPALGGPGRARAEAAAAGAPRPSPR